MTYALILGGVYAKTIVDTASNLTLYVARVTAMRGKATVGHLYRASDYTKTSLDRIVFLLERKKIL